jgi:hypothetical protein
MPLLEYPKCPHCQNTVHLSELWDIASTSKSGLLIGRTGIVCPRCQTKLRIIQWQSFLGIIASYACFVMYLDLTGGLGDFSLLFMLLGVVPLVVLPSWFIPRLALLRELKQGEIVRFPLEVERELYQATGEEESNTPASIPESSPWICDICHEENPATFELCWNCQNPKSESTE